MGSENYSSGDDIEFDKNDDVLKVMEMVEDFSEQIKMEKEKENKKGKQMVNNKLRISNQKTVMGSGISSEKQFKKNNQVFQKKEKHSPDLMSDNQQHKLNANKINKSSFLKKPVRQQQEFKQKLKIESYSHSDEGESINQITYRQSMKEINDPSHYKSWKKEKEHNQIMNNIGDYSTSGEFENKHKYSKIKNDRVDNRFQIDSDDDKVYKQRRKLRNDFTPQTNYIRKKTNSQIIDRRSNFQNGLQDHREYPNRTRAYSDHENGFDKINTYKKRENKKYDYRFKREFDDHTGNNQFSALHTDSGPTIEYTDKIPFGQGTHLKTGHIFQKTFKDQREYKQTQRQGFSSKDEFKTENTFNERINQKGHQGFQREFGYGSSHKQKTTVRNVYNPNSRYKRDHTNNQRTINKSDNNSEDEYDDQINYDRRLGRDSSNKYEFENTNSHKKTFNKKDNYSLKKEFYDKSGNNQRTQVKRRDSSPIIKYRNRNKHYQRECMNDDQSSQSDFGDQRRYKQRIRRNSISEDEFENKNTYNKKTYKKNQYSYVREFEDHSRKGERTKFKRNSSPTSKKYNAVDTFDERRKVADYSSQNESDDQQDYSEIRINRREDYNSRSESESEHESNLKINSSNRAHQKFESETGLSLVSRSEWEAPKPKWGCGPGMKTPVPNVFILTTDKRSCFNKEDCSKEMLFLASRHMKTQLCPDIKYNFVIGGDGRVYEGRGWITRPGLPTEHNKLNKFSLLIGLAGQYDDEYFPREMREARDKLIDYGVHHKYIHDDYTLHSPVD